MTGPVPPAGSYVRAAVVDGVDLDAVAAAARSCAAVDDLCSGAWGGVVSYLPGRQVAGVNVTFIPGQPTVGTLTGPSAALVAHKAEFSRTRVERWFT